MLAAKQLITNLLLQLLIVVTIMVVGGVVIAGMSSADAQTPTIVAQDSLERDLAEVQRTYRGQLEEYRLAHQQFVVAKQESVQLGTLSSLEAAVKATQKVMIIRDQVLLTYTKMLELELRLAKGVEVRLKNQTLGVLDETTKSITRHLENTQSSVDRQAIDTRATDFEAVEPLYSFAVGFTRQLLILAELRSGYDAAAAIFDDIGAQELTQSIIAKEERTRALEEVRLSLAEVDFLLDQAELEMEEFLVDAKLKKSKTLDDAYVELIQVVNFLDEVHLPTI